MRQVLQCGCSPAAASLPCVAAAALLPDAAAAAPAAVWQQAAAQHTPTAARWAPANCHSGAPCCLLKAGPAGHARGVAQQLLRPQGLHPPQHRARVPCWCACCPLRSQLCCQVCCCHCCSPHGLSCQGGCQACSCVRECRCCCRQWSVPTVASTLTAAPSTAAADLPPPTHEAGQLLLTLLLLWHQRCWAGHQGRLAGPVGCRLAPPG